jgi:hypothetical protein
MVEGSGFFFSFFLKRIIYIKAGFSLKNALLRDWLGLEDGWFEVVMMTMMMMRMMRMKMKFSKYISSLDFSIFTDVSAKEITDVTDGFLLFFFFTFFFFFFPFFFSQKGKNPRRVLGPKSDGETQTRG